MTDIIVVKPEALQDDPYLSLFRQIQDKYLFKVLTNEGMCVEIINFKTKECTIVNGTGDLQHQVEIKMVLFRPVKDEILVGKVARSNPDGIYDKCLWSSLRLSSQQAC